MSTVTQTLVLPAVPRPAGVRLTRRGRLVVLAFAVAVAFAVGVLLAAGSVATSDSGAELPTTVVTVSTGETLWGIAAEIADDGDVRATIHQIEQLNALESSMLIAGQRLRVPVG